MIITESFYEQSKQINSLLESIEYLEESDSPTSIGIQVQNNGNAFLKLEDLSNYMEANNIDQLYYGIRAISLANDIPMDNLNFVVREDHVIAEDKLLSMVATLQENNLPVYIVPISESSIIAQYGNFCLEQVELSDYEDYDYWIGNKFVNFLNEDYDNNPNGIASTHIEYKNGFEVEIRDIDGKIMERRKNGKRYDLHKDEPVYDRWDFEQDHRDPNERIQIIKSGKLVGKGSEGMTAAENQALIQALDDHLQKGEDPETAYRHAIGVQAGNFFAMGRGRGEHEFSNEFLDKEKGGLTEKGKKDLDFYEKALERDYQHRNTILQGGERLNRKEARDNEEEFNKAKEDTIKRLKDLHSGIPQSNIEGIQDENAAKRVEELSKMVENEKFPKSWLSKKIAWLRSLYRNVMYKWTIAQKKQGLSNIGGWIVGKLKRFAAFILRTIDKLALKLQNAVA